MFKIDGTEYDGVNCIVNGLNETFTLVEGLSSQRTQSKSMWYDIIGTEVTHTLTLMRDESLTLANWENLWKTLRSPSNDGNHTFEFPDGVNGSISYTGHITTGSRNLDFKDASGNYHWGDYTIVVTPVTPQY